MIVETIALKGKISKTASTDVNAKRAESYQMNKIHLNLQIHSETRELNPVKKIPQQ